MLNDIVEMPRRLFDLQTASDVHVSSEEVFSIPMPNIARRSGFWSPNDDDVVAAGNAVTLPTGRDALFRYKFIEYTLAGIIEYFVVTTSPIDILFPMRTKNVLLFCLWASVVDPVTLTTKRFIFWRNVIALCRLEIEDNVKDVPIEGVIAKEIRGLAEFYGCPEVAEAVKHYPCTERDLLISEARPPDQVGKLLTLGANIKAIHDSVDYGNWECDIFDLYNGLDLPEKWTNLLPLKDGALVPRFSNGPEYMCNIKHLFSSNYCCHPWHMGFLELDDLSEMTEIDVTSDDPRDLYGIFKYIEALPYSEFELRTSRGINDTCVVFDQYDFRRKVDPTNPAELRPVLDVIVDKLCAAFPNAREMQVIRSWSEEAYITVLNQNGSKEKYYFDMVASVLTDRNLIRDYNGAMFFTGL